MVIAETINRESRAGLLPCSREKPEAEQLHRSRDWSFLPLRDTSTETDFHLDDAMIVDDGHSPQLVLEQALVAGMAQIESKRIKLTKRHPPPETGAICPHFDAMEGVVNVIADHAVLAKDGSVVTVKAAVGRLVFRELFAQRIHTLDGRRGSNFASEHDMLGLRCHV